MSLRDRGQSTTGAEAKLQGLKESLGGKGKKMGGLVTPFKEVGSEGRGEGCP